MSVGGGQSTISCMIKIIYMWPSAWRGTSLPSIPLPSIAGGPTAIHSRDEVAARASLHVAPAAADAERQAANAVAQGGRGELVGALRDLVPVVGQVPESSTAMVSAWLDTWGRMGKRILPGLGSC